MKCPMDGREQAALLLDYVADKLEAEAAANLRDHLSSCAACAGFVSGQEKVWTALEDWDAAPVPANFDSRLYARIENQVSWWNRLMAPIFSHAMPVAAAAGIMVLAGVMLERPALRGPIARPTEAAQVEAIAPEEVSDALDDMQMLQEFNSLVHADTSAPRM
jgi:hypothetical protein